MENVDRLFDILEFGHPLVYQTSRASLFDHLNVPMDDSLVAHVVVVAKDDLHEVEVLQGDQEVAIVPNIEILGFKEHKNVFVVVLVAYLLGGYHLVLEIDLPDTHVLYIRLVDCVGLNLCEVHHKRKNVSFWF